MYVYVYTQRGCRSSKTEYAGAVRSNKTENVYKSEYVDTYIFIWICIYIYTEGVPE